MKILVPLDGSANAEAALAPALALVAHAAPPRKLVLSRIVADTLSMPDVTAADLALEETEQALIYLQAVPVPAAGITVTHKVGLGHPASVIALQATEEQADLIALTTHGRSGVARVVLGSVAAEVVQHATIPVLLTRANPTSALPKGDAALHILVPLDGSPEAEAILPMLRAMLHGWQMRLTLLTLVADSAPALALTEAQAYLTTVAQRFQDQASAVHVEHRVHVGDPTEAIPRYCQQHPPDLIALTRAHQGIMQWLLPLGGTFAACVAHTNVPVLVQSVTRTHPTHEA